MSIVSQNNLPDPPYEYQEYPKWVVGQIVNNAEEEAALTKPAKQKKRTGTDE